MVAWWWLILTAVLSGSAGALVMALLAARRVWYAGLDDCELCERVSRAYALGVHRGRRQVSV